MTESVTYQSSRVIKHTRIPQGVVRRMSLSVLVGQPVRWEGAGKNRRRIVAPPPPETMKTIRELVAGVTGFSVERGDQLVVESLPFESSMLPDASELGPTPGKPNAQPPWLEAFDKYRTVILVAIGALVLVAVLVIMLLRRSSGHAVKATAEQVSDELEAGEPDASLPAAPDMFAEARRLRTESQTETAERVRQLAQQDPALTANVLRMWLYARRPEVPVKSTL
jgi:flagellar M-ring protein FliF